MRWRGLLVAPTARGCTARRVFECVATMLTSSITMDFASCQVSTDLDFGSRFAGFSTAASRRSYARGPDRERWPTGPSDAAASMRHEDRDRGSLKDILRRAPEDELLQAHVAVGAHHDQVGAQIGGT